MTAESKTRRSAPNQATSRALACAVLLGAVLSGLPACTNSNTPLAKLSSSSAVSTTENATGSTHRISTVTIASGSTTGGATSGSSNGTITIYFNAADTQAINTVCEAAGGSSSSGATTKRCLCQLSWNETNTEGASAETVTRTARSVATIVQPNALSCATPAAYTEILDGTPISVKVVADTTNPSLFTMSSSRFTKGRSSDNGNFRDLQGRSFANILRYSCYNQTLRGMSIQSRTRTVEVTTTTGTETKVVPLANRFCVRKIRDGSDPATQTGCEDLAQADYSAQSYYFNLYIRENEVGDINPGNSAFVCPTVREPLTYYANGSGGGSSASSSSKYWPLDATFALSLAKTAEFSIGVVARSKTSNNNDPVSTSTSCETSSDGEQNTSSSTGPTILNSCLGFAAKPATDGTCSVMTDANGARRQTFRLRRYVAVYPQIFDTDGSPVQQPQLTDYIYVLDREVTNTAATATGSQPFTMLGPKPCPFAYFDRKGLTSTDGIPGYAATNKSSWTGKNVDGIQFPNTDSTNSCAAVMPLLNSNQTAMSLASVHQKSWLYHEKFVRPITAWAPHYEEDTEFQACAPRADPFRDPPLHFARPDAGGNVAWCAEAYPTQNDNIAHLDPRINPSDPASAYRGDVAPFTSHAIKGVTAPAASESLATTECAPTQPSIPTTPAYPAGLALHLGTHAIDADASNAAIYATKTCDRTVVNPQGGLAWAKFPLLAPPADVESALLNDPSYQCKVTYATGSSASKVNTSTPTQGCCGTRVQVWTGTPAAPYSAKKAHLEPDRACLTPEI